MESKRYVAATMLIIIFLLIGSCNSNEQLFPIIIQFNSGCYDESLVPNDITNVIENGNFVFIGTTASWDEIQELQTQVCVVRTFRPSELEDVISEIQDEFDAERDQQFQEQRLKRVIENKDVTGKEELKEYLQNKHKESLPSTILSEYQLYVTPDAEAVQELAETLDDVQEIYSEALSWVWVSEEYLNGETEYWYTPTEFLTITPTLDTNPAPGEYASDCSEQANTLTSLLIAKGYGEENVRVVLGKVNFNGQVGGHAWVEFYEDGQWIPLEATAGAYYYEDSDTVTEAYDIPYTYFQYHSYPVIEVWYYYNNEYFMDKTGNVATGNYPDNWTESSRSYLRDHLGNFGDGNSQNQQTRPRFQGAAVKNNGLA